MIVFAYLKAPLPQSSYEIAYPVNIDPGFMIDRVVKLRDIVRQHNKLGNEVPGNACGPLNGLCFRILFVAH